MNRISKETNIGFVIIFIGYCYVSLNLHRYIYIAIAPVAYICLLILINQINLFEKFLCKHKWKSHFKEKKYTQIYTRNIIGDNYNPTDITKEYVIEILICEHCGKIKKLKY